MNPPEITASWFEEYLQAYREHLDSPEIREDLAAFRAAILATRKRGGKLMLAGNGASASIAAHLAADFTKQAGIRSVTFNEANLLTALGNDFGYERWIEKAIGFYANPNDSVILISSSGSSPNIVRAAEFTLGSGLGLLTCSGFASDNPLRSLGHVNLWVKSRSYNIVECIHMIWLTAVLDSIIGKAEYSVGSST